MYSCKLDEYFLFFSGVKVYQQRCVKTHRRISVEKRSFCLQRSVFFTAIGKITWLYENAVRTISAGFGRSRSGKCRKIRTTTCNSDFLLANVFQREFLYATFFTLRSKQTFM